MTLPLKSKKSLENKLRDRLGNFEYFATDHFKRYAEEQMVEMVRRKAMHAVLATRTN